MTARFAKFGSIAAMSAMVMVASVMMPTAMAQSQYGLTPYYAAQYGPTQFAPTGNASRNVPMYAVVPAYLGQPSPTTVQPARGFQQVDPNSVATTRVTVRDDGTAAVSDSDPYYAQTATTGTSWSNRSQGVVANSNTNTIAAGAQSSSGFVFTSDLQRAVEQPYVGPPQLDTPPPQHMMARPMKLIPTVSGGRNMLVDDPNAPPDPNNLSGSSSSSESSDSRSAGSDSSASAGTCSTCGSGSCDCDSCQCDSCQCNSCGSCGGNCRCNKLFPILNIQDCCPLTCDDCPTDHLFSENCWLNCHDVTISGWLDGGIEANGRNTPDNYNGPLTFPDRRDGQGNQAWFAIDRSAPADNCGWFVGGHVDYFFGSDYFFTTAAGLDGTSFGNVPRWNTTDSFLYGLSMPQLYAETDYGTDTKIKWGHFFTIIGYEVVPAIGNFFYSHSYTMQYGEPFTHTGMLASQTHCNWTFYGGITAGWNIFSADDRAAFLGGATYTDKDWGSLAFAITTGDDSEFNFPGVGPFANRTMYSLVWSRNFTSRLTYVLQHDLGSQEDAATFHGGGAQWYGINQYLFYKLNCCWTAGIRAEWFRDDDGFMVTGLRPGNSIQGASFPGNFYEITAGLNYK
ncbi:MAG TPA: outer membrane beta-barrel protein, partial [Pirellulales bacterium]